MNRHFFRFSTLLSFLFLVLTAPVWALLTSPTLTPTTLPATGGTLTVSAKVTFPEGVYNVLAQMYSDNKYVDTISLSNGNIGSTYSGNYPIYANRDGVTHTYTAVIYTAVIYVTDPANNMNSAAATGSCVVDFDNTVPSITAATLTPTTRPSTGGTLAISATVTDAGTGVKTVSAQIRTDNTYNWYDIITLTNYGGGTVYTGAANLPANDSGRTITYTAVIHAEDNAGNIGALTATGSCAQTSSVTTTSPPTITNAKILPVTLPAPGGTLTISAAVSDTAGISPGVQYVHAQLFQDMVYYDTVTLSSTGVGSNYAGTYDIGPNTTQIPRLYTAVICAVDNDNNRKTAVASGTTTQVIASGPTISAAALTPATMNAIGGMITVTATIADSGAGIYSTGCQIKQDGRYIGEGYLTDQVGNVYIYTLNVLDYNTSTANRTFTAIIYALDNTYKLSSRLATGTCVQAFDRSGPVISSPTVSPATVPANGATITVSATVTDTGGNNTGVNEVYAYLLLDGIYQTYYYLSNGGSGNVYTCAINGYGNNTTGSARTLSIIIVATDKVGNQTNKAATPTITFASDATPPVITTPMLTPTSLPTTGGSLTINATITDTGGTNTGLNSYTRAIIFRDGVYADMIWLNNGGSGTAYTGSYNLGINVDAITHVFTASIEATDNTDNTARVPCSGTCTQASDNTAPLITSATLSPASFPATGGTLTVSATVTDSGGGNSGISSVQALILVDGAPLVNLYLDNGGSGTQFTGELDWTINRGPAAHVFTAIITAVDNANNSASLVATGTTNQPTDKTGPSVTSATLTPSSRPATGGTVTISATVTDSGSGLDSISAQLRTNGVYYTEITLSNGGSGNIYSGSYTFGANNGNQALTWSVVVSAVDHCNNTTNVTATGTCNQPTTSASAGPAITNAKILPASLTTMNNTYTEPSINKGINYP